VIIGVRRDSSHDDPAEQCDEREKVQCRPNHRNRGEPGQYPRGDASDAVDATHLREVQNESLVQHTTSLPKRDDPDSQKRAWMSNDLVDVYYQSGNEARVRLVRAAQQVGGDDLAKVLGGVQPGEYAIVQRQAHDTNAKLDELRARQSDPALIEVRDQMRELGNVDQSKMLGDMATRPH